jgi:hypothetical protein
MDALVENMLSGEIAIGDAYAHKMQNTIFAVLTSGPQEEADVELGSRLARTVKDAAERHHFD